MSPARLRRHAFTLLELLTVVGIIAILISLLVVGGLKMIATGKVASTRVTLNVLQNMLAEFDAKTRLTGQPQQWAWFSPDTTAIAIFPSTPNPMSPDPIVQSNGINFWKVPWSSTKNTTPFRYDALTAPSDVSENSPVDRNLAPAVLNTTAAMAMLLNLPTNRSVIEKMSADRFFSPLWTNPNTQINMPRIGSTYNMLLAGEDGLGAGTYAAGCVVQLPPPPPPAPAPNPPLRFRAIIDTSDSSGPGIAAPDVDTAHWIKATSASPILMDAWNNPIIFVPATGMRVRLLNGESKYVDNGGVPKPSATTFKAVIVTSPEGQIDYIDTPQKLTKPYVVKPGRPFFASAGPDGNFATGDDNLYSFEQQ